MDINKYTISDNEAEEEVLSNLFNLTTTEEIDESEFIGFIHAQQKAIDELSDDTVFDVLYLYKLHKNALGHLYSFAGKLRTVNISKGHFAFAPASFLLQAMEDFEIEFLNPLKERSLNEIHLLKKLARMHAELLFIHPFREGNGRTIRMFTNMIYLSKTGKELDFKILEHNLETYIKAVQQAGQKEYVLMEKLFLDMSSGFK
jgi:cell filamentation protein